MNTNLTKIKVTYKNETLTGTINQEAITLNGEYVWSAFLDEDDNATFSISNENENHLFSDANLPLSAFDIAIGKNEGFSGDVAALFFFPKEEFEEALADVHYYPDSLFLGSITGFEELLGSCITEIDEAQGNTFHFETEDIEEALELIKNYLKSKEIEFEECEYIH